MSLKTITVEPTANIAAGGELDLAGYIEGNIGILVGVHVGAGRSVDEGGTATYDILALSTKTVIENGRLTTTAPAAGQVALSARKKVKFGDAVTTKDIIVIRYLLIKDCDSVF